MAVHDARVQEIEVLQHFASSIGQLGASLSETARQIDGAAIMEMDLLQSMLQTLRDRYEKAQNDYGYALEELHDAQEDYQAYLRDCATEDRSAADLDALRQRIESCRAEADAARDLLDDAHDRLSQGEQTVMAAKTVLMQVRSLSETFAMSISDTTGRTADHVRKAAAHLIDYLTH